MTNCLKRGPISGVGIGLRSLHFSDILEQRPSLPWFEVLTDNFIQPGGLALDFLQRIRQHYPIVMHSVGLSVGSTDPIDKDYLSKLKEMRDVYAASWISEHLCWTSVHGMHMHDLMPLPYNEETIKHVALRIAQVQDYLGERLLIENVSTYLNFKNSTMPEWDFVSEVARQADCYLLVDINNIYVSGQNHGYDPAVYLAAMPKERVKQLHLAGFERRDDHLLDSHSKPVADAVWQLYKKALQMWGPVPTLIEWDSDIPPLSALLVEQEKADVIYRQCCTDGEVSVATR